MGPVIFAPFEEVAETGAVSNPVYAAIGMTRISSSQDINKEGAKVESDATEASSEGNALQDEAAGELPKKEPFVKEKEAEEKPEYMAITVKKEAEGPQEEPRYMSLSPNNNEVADNEQVKIDVRGDVERGQNENNYVTLIGDQQVTGQTDLVLEDNDKEVGESES